MSANQLDELSYSWSDVERLVHIGLYFTVKRGTVAYPTFVAHCYYTSLATSYPPASQYVWNLNR